MWDRSGTDPCHYVYKSCGNGDEAKISAENEPVMSGDIWHISCSLFCHFKHAYNYSADNIAREEQRYQCMREIIAKEHLTYEDETEFITSLLGEISLVKNSGIEIANYYSKNCAETVFRKVYRQYHEFCTKTD